MKMNRIFALALALALVFSFTAAEAAVIPGHRDAIPGLPELPAIPLMKTRVTGAHELITLSEPVEALTAWFDWMPEEVTLLDGTLGNLNLAGRTMLVGTSPYGSYGKPVYTGNPPQASTVISGPIHIKEGAYVEKTWTDKYGFTYVGKFGYRDLNLERDGHQLGTFAFSVATKDGLEVYYDRYGKPTIIIAPYTGTSFFSAENPASSGCVVWSVRIYGAAKRRTWCLSSITENFDEGNVASITAYYKNGNGELLDWYIRSR